MTLKERVIEARRLMPFGETKRDACTWVGINPNTFDTHQRRATKLARAS